MTENELELRFEMADAHLRSAIIEYFEASTCRYSGTVANFARVCSETVGDMWELRVKDAIEALHEKEGEGA